MDTTQAPKLMEPVLVADRRYEVQRQNHFELYFEDEPHSVFSLAVQSVKTPVVGTGVLPRMEISFKDFYRSNLSLDMVTDLMSYMAQWFEDTQERLAAKLEPLQVRNFILVSYNPDGKIARCWRLVGAYPVVMDYGSYNYDTSGQHKFGVVFEAPAFLHAPDHNPHLAHAPSSN